MNLYKELTEHDNIVIKNFITSCQIVEDKYIGNEAFLSEWAKNNTKLYHLLGNKFIHKIPYEKEMELADIIKEMKSMINNSYFCDKFERLIYNASYKYKNFKTNLFLLLINPDTLIDNVIKMDIVLDYKKDKKVIKIQKGTKTMKAILKVCEYFDFGEEFPDKILKEDYENFRIAHSMVLNNKKLKGNLVMSIHPMDFMTMSDNGFDWSSCMSFVRHGCYHMGAEEMMNSNNVICCYLESTTNPLFCFKDMDEHQKTPIHSVKEYPNYSWTNKKWEFYFMLQKILLQVENHILMKIMI